jgi:tetratricopeptide (TPR) repeat protein
MSKTYSALIFILLLVAVTIAVYFPSLGNELVFDDRRLTDGSIFGVFGNVLELRPRMLSYGSFVWLKSLVGDSWWAQRLVNVILHVGVALGLYGLFTQLLMCQRFSQEIRSDADFLPSTQAALRVGVVLFALNPVAVYAVAYLVQRSTVMAALFVVLACIAWVRGLVSSRYYWLGLALLFYVLAVMSKEAAVMAAALAIPLYVFVARPGWKRIVLIVSLSLVPILVAAWILLKVYGSIIGTAFDETSRLYVQQLETLSPGISARLYPLSILNQAELFFRYGLLWFVPNIQWMSIDLRPPFPLSLGSIPHLLGALGFLALLVGAAWLLLRGANMLAFLGLCLLFPLLLFFSEFVTVWVQDPFVLYRSYLWALPLPGLVALALLGLKPKMIYPIGVLLALLFAGLALDRAMSFKSELSVWSDAIEKVDRNANPSAVGRWRPYINRGAYYLDREMPDYAYEDFSQAEALGEPYGSSRFNMGVSQQLMKKHQDALASFAKAEAMGFTEALLYYHRGESLRALGRFAQAYDSYSIALAKSPDPKLASHMRMRRAEAATAAQKYDAAVADFNLLLKDSPNDQELMMGLGMAYVGKSDSAAALVVFDRLLAVRPTAAAHYGRGLAYVVASDRKKAMEDLDRAVSLDPGNPLYANMRAKIAAQK